ncbi:MarR family winged helix-turn-helix transcriptional regulator [Agrococcus jejuensis]|uniref:MarR family winged helix-turn-helix transcriptional regulator n=1 Tax=Agrococcus jejuensis TaxID=399736 RepID=UPI001642FEE9|nr:MarR family transcriptional regulator [Agrococcus jejuensis]
MATSTTQVSLDVEPDVPGDDPTTQLTWAVEELRLAESRLSRRRQTSCGPGHSEREAMRFIADRADAGKPATPTEVATHLGLTTPSVSAIIRRLQDGGLISTRQHADDRRSKLLEPSSRNAPDTADALAPAIRAAAAELDPAEAKRLAAFLAHVRDLVDADCRD